MTFASSNSVDIYYSQELNWGEDPQQVSISTSLSVVAASFQITRAAGSFITDGVTVGMYLTTSGFANSGNNGNFLVAAVAALTITLDAATVGLVDEGPIGVQLVSAPLMTQLRLTGESLSYKKDTVVSEQIRADRMRDTVAEVGFSTSGSINYELAFGSYDPLFAGACANNWQTVDLTTDLTITAASRQITRGAGSFSDDGIVAGMYIRTQGFATSANNGVFRVDTVATTILTLDTNATTLGDEVGTNNTITAKMLRNGTTELSFLCEKRFTDIDQFIAFHGMRVNNCELEFSAKEVITGSFSFMGKTSLLASASVAGQDLPSSPTSILTASANVGTILLDNSAVPVPVKSISLNLGNNLREQTQVGSLSMAGVGYGFADVTGELVVYFQDAAMYQKVIDHDTISLSWRCTDSAGNVLVFTLPRIYLTADAPSASSGNQDVMLSLEYTAVRDATTNCMIQLDSLAA